MKHLQQVKAGLQCLQVKKIRKQDGTLCECNNERLNRWSDHFAGVLNVRSHFDMMHIENLPQQVETFELANSRCLDEVEKAIKALKLDKASGDNAILPNC